MEKNKGKIITTFSMKGGVGKTIIVLNLAGIYALMNKKVIILDLDLFGGNIATYLNSTNDKTIFNFVEDLSNNRYKDLSDYVFKYNQYIDIIASCKDPRQANKIDYKYIPIILRNIIYKYDIILIDTSSSFNNANIMALDNSDKILYVFTNDVFDIKNSRSFMNVSKDADMNNVVTLLNASLPNSRSYFSLYDIKNVLKSNIDFVLDRNLYIPKMDKHILESKIITLKESNVLKKRTYSKLVKLAYQLIEDNKK